MRPAEMSSESRGDAAAVALGAGGSTTSTEDAAGGALAAGAVVLANAPSVLLE
jgi:hypothetical protein